MIIIERQRTLLLTIVYLVRVNLPKASRRLIHAIFAIIVTMTKMLTQRYALDGIAVTGAVLCSILA